MISFLILNKRLLDMVCGSHDRTRSTHDVVEANEVLEGKRGGKAGVRVERLLCDDLEQQKGILRLLLFLFEGVFGC